MSTEERDERQKSSHVGPRATITTKFHGFRKEIIVFGHGNQRSSPNLQPVQPYVQIMTLWPQTHSRTFEDVRGHIRGHSRTFEDIRGHSRAVAATQIVATSIQNWTGYSNSSRLPSTCDGIRPKRPRLLEPRIKSQTMLSFSILALRKRRKLSDLDRPTSRKTYMWTETAIGVARCMHGAIRAPIPKVFGSPPAWQPWHCSRWSYRLALTHLRHEFAWSPGSFMGQNPWTYGVSHCETKDS